MADECESEVEELLPHPPQPTTTTTTTQDARS
jgi:hypothetical protein